MKILTLSNKTDWITLVAQSGIQSVVTENKYGKKFLSLYGNTFVIKDKLSNMGFKYFKGTWGKAVDQISDSERNELQSLGIDITPLTAEKINEVDRVEQVKEELVDPSQKAQVELSPVEKELQKMKDGVKMAMKEEGSEKVRSLLTFVDRMIERVADMTDEASQSEFIKNFIAFAARFHNYSFGNQILIWVQKPTASYVRGYRQWIELGREVKNWENGITIIGPRYKKAYTPEEISKADAEARDAMERKRHTYFSALTVYDVSDTAPISNYEQQTGKKPFEPQSWRKDTNESMEEITILVNAAKNYALSKNINVDFEEMTGDMGGFSAGGKIRINNTYDGIALFSTMVHEIAHEILHWTEERKQNKGVGEGKQESRQAKEIDAETTSYIVLKHYGFETKDTPNYLALWKAKGEDIKERRSNISIAVKQIVEGIDSSVKNMVAEDAIESEKGQGVIQDRTPEVIANSVKLIRNASGQSKIKISYIDWKNIGIKKGWIR